MNDLQAIIEQAWEERDTISSATRGEIREAVDHALDLLDGGSARVAEKMRRELAHQPVAEEGRAAVLPPQRHDARFRAGPAAAQWWDKVPSKFEGWGANASAMRDSAPCPARVVRHSAYIAPGAILMPSFVNLGAYVDSGTMVDTWVTVGLLRPDRQELHLSGGVGIGGVLEPMQAGPTIIEDNCFIGARSEVVEGVHRRRRLGDLHGRLLGLDQDHRPHDGRGLLRQGAALFGGGFGLPCRKPLPDGSPGPGLYCAVIVKRVDEKTRAKTSINDLLRD